jgi:hypothetical protein
MSLPLWPRSTRLEMNGLLFVGPGEMFGRKLTKSIKRHKNEIISHTC